MSGPGAEFKNRTEQNKERSREQSESHSETTNSREESRSRGQIFVKTRLRSSHCPLRTGPSDRLSAVWLASLSCRRSRRRSRDGRRAAGEAGAPLETRLQTRARPDSPAIACECKQPRARHAPHALQGLRVRRHARSSSLRRGGLVARHTPRVRMITITSAGARLRPLLRPCARPRCPLNGGAASGPPHSAGARWPMTRPAPPAHDRSPAAA